MWRERALFLIILLSAYSLYSRPENSEGKKRHLIRRLGCDHDAWGR